MDKLTSLRTMSLFPSTISLQTGDKRLLGIRSGWFIVQVLVFLSSGDIQDLINQKIAFASENMISTGVFKMYLTEQQANYLLSKNIANLIPIEKPRQLHSVETGPFLVKAIPNWTPPAEATITGQITDSIYTVRGVSASILYNDERVLSVEALPEAEACNRYSTGFIQSGTENLEYDGPFFESNRVINKNGLDGSGHVVTVLDTGLDSFHPFFHDRKHAVPINATNKDHRKIVRYDAKEDDFDNINGHGTHVAGTVAGDPLCTGCGMKMYRGMAPEAKIYFVDQGKSNATDSNISSEVDWLSILPNMRDVNSYVSSNSWGFPIMFQSFTEAYDKLAYDNPDILHVFAAGNKYSYNSINAPGDSKNVLTVGALTAPKSRLYDDIFSNNIDARRVFLVSGDEQIRLYPKANFNLWQYAYDNPSKIPIDCNIVDFEKVNLSDVQDAIVRVNLKKVVEDDCNVTRALYDNGAKAMIMPMNVLKTCSDESLNKNFIIMRYEASDDDYVLSLKKGTFTFIRTDENELPSPVESKFTSKGPVVWSSMTKPDISAPGENVISARAGDPEDKSVRSLEIENLVNKSGTSMATPIISSSAVLVRQFFTEKYYPNFKKGEGKEINPSATLLRAMLINSAESPNVYKSVPTNDIGFGNPVLSNIFGYNGMKIRVIDNQKIESRSHHVYSITITNKKQFSVTMSYLDPAVSATRGYIFFADLDLYVEAPDGSIKVGNIYPKPNVLFTDSFATNEKVVYTFSQIQDGEYKIHVTSSVYPMKKDIKYSLVVTGDFEDTTPDPLPMTKATTCPKNCGGNGQCVDGQCVCKHGFADFTCETKVISMGENFPYSTSDLVDKEITYYSRDHHYPISKEYPLKLEFRNVYIDDVACFSKKMGKLANPDWTCYKSKYVEYKPATPIFENEPVYIAVFRAIRKLAGNDFKDITFRINTTSNTLTPGPPQSENLNPVDPTTEAKDDKPVNPTSAKQDDKPVNPTTEAKDDKPVDPKTSEIKNDEKPQTKPIVPDPAYPSSKQQEPVKPSVNQPTPDDSEANLEQERKEKNKTIGIAVGAAVGGVAVIVCVVVISLYIRKHLHFKKLQNPDNDESLEI